MNPKTFVSHAGEDREFVADLCANLREHGVDAWYSGWEILPGDSLVEKIFNMGLKTAQVVIVVLSHHSVDKPWVREELDAAIVKRINEGTRLISVVIDACEVPLALRSTKWERIRDPKHYDEELQRIVMAIYGQYQTPPLGNSPAYTRATAIALPGLTRLDSLILRLLGDEAVADGRTLLNPVEVVRRAGALDVPKAETYDALDALEHAGYISAERLDSPEDPIFLVTFTADGFEQYARAYVQGYADMKLSVVSQLVNAGARDSHELAVSTNEPPIIVEHVLHLLARQRLLELAPYETGALVAGVSPQLKRSLRTGR
jgi:TIR domain